MDNKFDYKHFTCTPSQQIIEKPWGHEVIFTPKDSPAAGKILYVNAGKRLSLQYHDEKIETLCLIKGKANITLTNEKGEQIEVPMELEKGYFVQPGQVHRVTAITDIIFLESGTPETGNTFRLQDDTGRATETETIRQSERS